MSACDDGLVDSVFYSRMEKRKDPSLEKGNPETSGT